MRNFEKGSLPREQVIAGIELAKTSLEEIRTSIRSLHECLQVGTAAVEDEKMNIENAYSSPFLCSQIPYV